MKKLILSLVVFNLLFLVSVWLVRAEEVSQGTAATETSQAVNVGNKICPVSGEKIKEETKETYEYEGKIYNFCCKACLKDFKKDPEKYIKKVEEELKAKTQETQQPQAQEGMHEEHHH